VGEEYPVASWVGISRARVRENSFDTCDQVEHDLLPQDSIVYASVLDHMESSESTSKCFLNRNSKDFDDPDIVETLRKHGCKMLFRFDHGHGYITSQLSS